MATSISLNGTSYLIPAIGESGWGTQVSAYLVALSTGILTKAGGSVTLTADVDFGASFGLKSLYYKSRTAAAASTGAVRLANTESLAWRNAANSADLALTVDSSDVLSFGGNPIVNISLGTAYAVLQMNAGATAFSWATPTGTGTPVLATSPTLVTPVLGVATATSINKLTLTAPATGSTLTIADGKTATVSNTLTFTGTDGSSVAFGAGGTVAYTSGTLAQFAATTSAQLASVISDETGSGALVFATSPSFTTPSLGVATAVTLNGVAFTPSTSATIQVGNSSQLTLGASAQFSVSANKIASFSNSLILAGTDSTTMTFPSTSGTVMTLGAAATVTGAKTFAQTTLKLQDDSTNVVTLSTTNSTTSYTIKLPAVQGGTSTTLSNDGSGNLTWVSQVSSSLNQFNIDIGNASNNRSPTNSNLLGDVAASTATATVTITIAAPGVVSDTGHALNTGDKIYLTTTGALPTGLSASTTYYVVKIDANSYSLASTRANAVAGTKITTTGSQSGTHSRFSGALTFSSIDARIPGKISGNNDTAGYVGEMQRSTVTSASASGVTAGQFGNVTSLTLTPGHWLVYATLKNTRVSGQAESTLAISTNTGNTTTDHIVGYTEMSTTDFAVGAGNTVITLLPWDQSISSSTTYFMKAKMDAGTWTQANFVGTIFAVRTT